MRFPSGRAAGRAGWPWVAAAGALLAAGAVTAARGETAEPPHSAELDAAIVRAAKMHGVPEHLVRRVVMRESRYNPRARNHSFWGLMQISYPTARSMGFKGTPEELLNPVTNLTYAVPYLANAFVAAGKREDAAIRLYAHGYYDAARHRGLLGALRTADSAPAAGFQEDQPAPAPPSGDGFFGLFGVAQASPEPQPAPPAAEAQAVPAAAPAAVAQAAPGAARGRAVADGGTAADGIPAKWRRDGGTTVLARGEQNLAAHAAAQAAGRHAGHSRKITEFAALDAPPAAAQAYSAVGGSEAAAAPPQMAISQAIAPDGAERAAAPDAQPAPEATAGAKDARKAAKHHANARTAKAKSDATTEPKS